MNRLPKNLSIYRAQNLATALNGLWDSEEEDADEGDVDIIDRCNRGFLINNLFFSLAHFPLIY